MTDILKTQTIYLSCNIARESYYKGTSSNIIYSFANTKRYGNFVYFNPSPRERMKLVVKNFVLSYTLYSSKPWALL